MTRITLGFKAFDAHELLCHFVAVKAGLYRREKFEVELVDITFMPDDELPAKWFQASCGAALASAVKGLYQRVVFVAVDRPMFWIWSRTGMDGLAGLARHTLATFPPLSPPHALTNAALRQAGVDPARDVTLMSARDDVARLGLLRSCSVDAAVMSSAVPPARMAALGFHRVGFLGDELRIPTTGLATDASRLQQEPELVRTLIGLHRQALRLILEDAPFTSSVLTDWFDVDTDIARRTAEDYAASFTRDGRTSEDIAHGAVEALARSMGVAEPPDWEEIYRFDDAG